MRPPTQPILIAAFWLGLAIATVSAADTNSDTARPGWPKFPGLVLEYGFPTNEAVAYARGQIDARQDIANGLLATKTYGLPAPWASNYEELLQQRCGVREEGVAGCIVSAGAARYAAGYNDISCPYIEQKFGTNIFDELANEAQANWQKERGPDTYNVRARDTMTKIARHHGVMLKALIMANPGLDPNKLKVGQKLIIPAPAKNP